MAKKSFLVPVALTVAALAVSANSASAELTPTTPPDTPLAHASGFAPVGDLVLERADGSRVRLADHSSHESHSSHASHDSHASHSSHSSHSSGGF